MKKGGMKVNEKRGGKNSTKILEDAINWGRGTFFWGVGKHETKGK